MKKTNFAKDNITSLPPWAKGVIAVGGLVIIGYIVYKVAGLGKDRKEDKPEREEAKEIKEELQELESKPSTKATLTKSQMLGFANGLFAAMDGYGTDEAAIYRIFNNVKNLADVLGISAAYGVREVSSGRLNPEPNVKGGLQKCLTTELDSKEMKELNLILAKKGIKYRF